MDNTWKSALLMGEFSCYWCWCVYFVNLGHWTFCVSYRIHQSISYAFYASSQLNWRGVNVELDPDNYHKLTMNRRNDISNIHAAVCSDSQTVHYALAKDKSSGGIWEFTTETYRNHFWPNMTMFQAIPMQCTPMQRILDHSVKCDNMHFDFMSINVNGAEYSSLLGLNFEKVR